MPRTNPLLHKNKGGDSGFGYWSLGHFEFVSDFEIRISHCDLESWVREVLGDCPKSAGRSEESRNFAASQGFNFLIPFCSPLWRRNNAMWSAMVLVVAFAAAGMIFHATVRGADWPRFRGPNGSGVSTEKKPLPAEWSDTKNLKWKAELPGPGNSCPIVVGDRVFVTCWTGYHDGSQDGSTRTPETPSGLHRPQQPAKSLWDRVRRCGAARRQLSRHVRRERLCHAHAGLRWGTGLCVLRQIGRACLRHGGQAPVESRRRQRPGPPGLGFGLQSDLVSTIC